MGGLIGDKGQPSGAQAHRRTAFVDNRTAGVVEAEVKPYNLQQERSFGLRATTLTLRGGRLILVG
jgi:hypothetical protein